MQPSFSLVGMIKDMGWPARIVGIVLIVMAIYFIAVALERLFTFLNARSRSFGFVIGLRDRMRGRDVKAALALAKNPPFSPLSRLVGAGLEEYLDSKDLPEFDVADAVQRALERVRERELADLRRGLSGLATIASAAPFVGLFGTVVGIITAFQSMATQGGGLQAVSGGISEALVTTAAGLFVAIPAVVVFNYFTNKVDEFAVDMNEVSGELVAFVLKDARPAAAPIEKAAIAK
jgi:biopolymer transport protein ExbB/TolQ